MTAPRWTAPALGALAALALGLWLHTPLVRSLGDALPGEGGSDVLRATWSAWLVAEALPWPFATSLAGWPDGVDLLPFPAFSLLLLSPFTLLFGAQQAVGMLVVGHTALLAWGTGALARDRGAGWGACAAAGALAATQPLMGGALRDGTLEVLALGWVPLCWLAWHRVVKGETRWAAPAAALSLVCALESAYSASFAAVGTLVLLGGVRRPGLRATTMALGLSALGALALALAFRPLLEAMSQALDQTGDDPHALRLQNAVDPEMALQLSLSPGSRGFRVSDLWAPPWPQAAVLLLGLLLGGLQAPGLALAGLAFLLISTGSPAIFFDTPLGAVLRFPRRAVGPGVVALAAGFAAGLTPFTRRFPRLELAGGLALAAWLAGWGAMAGGWFNTYPLITPPRSEAAAWVAADPEDCAMAFLPAELEGNQRTLRSEAPVFGELSRDLASGDLPLLQAQAGKAAPVAPALITLHPRGTLPRVLTDLNDLARRSVPGSALREPAIQAAELQRLAARGLKYLLVDRARYGDAGWGQLEAVLALVAVERRTFDEGTGIEGFRLYDTRPTAGEAPEEWPARGVIDLPPGRVGAMRLRARVGDTWTECPVKPEDGSFSCPGVESPEALELTVDGQPATLKAQGGRLRVE